MPTGIRPRVNEAREFLEVAKDFKDPKEIIREALSNSWDAGSSHVAIKFDLTRLPNTRRKKSVVEISDDGEGSLRSVVPIQVNVRGTLRMAEIGKSEKFSTPTITSLLHPNGEGTYYG